MAKTDSRPKAPPKPKPFLLQLIFLPWTLFSRLFTGLLIAILLSIVIEWIGMIFWWDEEHAQRMFIQEYNVIKTSFNFSILGSPPIILIN